MAPVVCIFFHIQEKLVRPVRHRNTYRRRVQEGLKYKEPDRTAERERGFLKQLARLAGMLLFSSIFNRK
jgi:hypothetical protein